MYTDSTELSWYWIATKGTYIHLYYILRNSIIRIIMPDSPCPYTALFCLHNNDRQVLIIKYRHSFLLQIRFKISLHSSNRVGAHISSDIPCFISISINVHKCSVTITFIFIKWDLCILIFTWIWGYTTLAWRQKSSTSAFSL